MARIVLIDDDPIIAALVKQALARSGHDLLWLDNGNDALADRACARIGHDEVRFDVVRAAQMLERTDPVNSPRRAGDRNDQPL